MSVAWQFYISTVLIYLGVDVIACWGLNLQFGVAGLVNFAFIIFQAAGAYTAAVFSPEYKDVVAFVILVVVLLARPQGILSEVATRKEVAA